MNSNPIVISSNDDINAIKKQFELQQWRECMGKRSGNLVSQFDWNYITPIQFAGGCKTEIRLLDGLEEINKNPDNWVQGEFFPNGTNDGMFFFHPDVPLPYYEMMIKCPYGVPGDELWVKEGFDYYHILETYDPFGETIDKSKIFYQADGVDYINQAFGFWGTWQKPNMMPYWSSRITMRIESVTIQRLHDITAADCIREGISTLSLKPDIPMSFPMAVGYMMEYKEKFMREHGSAAWILNPWVWVIKFSVKNIRRMK